MTANGWLQIAIYFVVLTALVVPLGRYMARVFEGERTFLSPVLRPVETGLYRVSGRRRDARAALDHLHGGDAAVQRSWLPAGLCDPAAAGRCCRSIRQSNRPVPADLAFNTAVSFATNTNWQNYGGESTLSYLTPDGGLTTQNFVSAATGIALADRADPRLCARSANTVGNFWVDLTRSTLYVLLPLSIVLGAVPGLAGRAAEPRRLCRCNHARGRQADVEPGPGGLADRHQAARHQRRRLLERQLVASPTRTRRRSAISSRCSPSC